MQINDKRALRKELIIRRRQMDKRIKSEMDKAIADNVLASDCYKSADSLLIYISTEIEVDTRQIIMQAFKDEKAVYAPRCMAGDGEMCFCKISSFNDLEPGYKGILEPNSSCQGLVHAGKMLCVVPALAYDLQGFRLGYGKGYYDRFLAGFTCQKLGICYDEFILDDVFRDKHDVPVDMIISDKREIFIDDRREE